MRLVVVGAAGRMGCALIRALLLTPGANLSGAIEREGSPALGQDAGALVGLPETGIKITSDPLAAFAQADASAVRDEGSRTIFETPYLHLAVDSAHPSLELLGYAPIGDRHFGGTLGTIVEEAHFEGNRRRSHVDDADGARLQWSRQGNNTVVQLEGIDVGPGAVSTWLITIPASALMGAGCYFLLKAMFEV